MSQNNLLEQIEKLQDALVAFATGGKSDLTDEEFKQIRAMLLSDPSVRGNLPELISKCRDLSQYWNYIKGKFAHYQERREFLWNEFAPVIEKLERFDLSPIDKTASVVLEEFDAEYVHHAWVKTLERRTSDPEGAITMARTLLESVCKHILDSFGKQYNDSEDLPKLYRQTAEQLNLAPTQHTEQIFKQILGGCESVVTGLAGMRNKHSDSHGTGPKIIKPATRHAELAVNLAGSMATFLIRTYEHKKSVSPIEDALD